MNALIVDDERHCRVLLTKLINKYLPYVNIIGEAENVDQACSLINIHRPNIIFLDIQMPKKDGFQLLNSLEFNSVPDIGVIFTTAYDNYAIKAFRYAAIDYLLKPINKDELIDAVYKFKKTLNQHNAFNSNLDFLKSINKSADFKRICLSSKKGMIFTELADILFFKAEGSYTDVMLTNNKTILVSKSIISFEKLFENNEFIRVHRSYLVNTKHILEYNFNENYLMLTNNVKIEVSNRKKNSVTNYLASCLKP